MRIELRKPALPGGAFVVTPEDGPIELMPYSVEVDRQFTGRAAVFEAVRTETGLVLVRPLLEREPDAMRLPPRVAERPRRR